MKPPTFTENTDDGNWQINYEDFFYHYDGTVVTNRNETGRLLQEELQQRKEISELIMTEDCIEMTYHMEYCPNCQQGGLEGALSLFSLMGCNLYDVHLCHSDEDHELATVTELNRDTLTEDGNRNWSAAMGAFRLLHHISRIIQNRLEDERRGKGGAHIDRKLRRRIRDKNETLGIKQG